MARFLVEKPNDDNKVVFNENLTISRYELRSKLDGIIAEYPIYNGLKMTGFINKIINELEDIRGRDWRSFQFWR